MYSQSVTSILNGSSSVQTSESFKEDTEFNENLIEQEEKSYPYASNEAIRDEGEASLREKNNELMNYESNFDSYTELETPFLEISEVEDEEIFKASSEELTEKAGELIKISPSSEINEFETDEEAVYEYDKDFELQNETVMPPGPARYGRSDENVFEAEHYNVPEHTDEHEHDDLHEHPEESEHDDKHEHYDEHEHTGVSEHPDVHEHDNKHEQDDEHERNGEHDEHNLHEYETVPTDEYDEHFASEDSTFYETAINETAIVNGETEIEYDVPTPQITTPAASPSCDLSIAVTQFEPSQRKKISSVLLSPLKNKKAIEWNTAFLKKININPQHVLTDLERYVDLQAVRQAIDAYNKTHSSAIIAPGNAPIDAIFAEAVHQFQKKIFFDSSLTDGLAGAGSLHSLGITSFAQDPKKLASNDFAKGELKYLNIKVQINGKECNYSNWFNFTYNPSFLGITFNRPVHYLLIKQLRTAEGHLLNSSRFKGDNLVEMGTKLGLGKNTEQHAGGRTSGAGMHTFGLALDIDHRNNPWIGAGWISKPKDEIYNKLSEDKRKRIDSVLNEKYRILDVFKKASGQKLYGEKISVYLDHVGRTKGADTNKGFDELKQRNDEFKTYLKSNPAELSHWQKSATFQHGKASNGFLNLDRDLVYALRQVGNLAWGAIDFGAGEGADGDIMHFDLRTLEIGRKINLKKRGAPGGDPLKTHPYLLKSGGEAKEINEIEDLLSYENFEKWEEGESEESNMWEIEDETPGELLSEDFVPSVSTTDLRTRIDEYLEAANAEYTLVDGTKVKARSQFRYGWKGQSLPPEAAKVKIKKALMSTKAGAKFVSDNNVAIHYTAYGRATPAQIKKITQALIDSGEFAKLRTGDTTSSDGQLIRKLQRKFGVGIDCAGYVQLAFIYAYTGSDSDPKTTRIKLGLKERRGDERLDSLPSKHFKKLDVVSAQTGDLLILKPRAGEIDNANHTVIVVDHTSSGSTHSFIVDASWGTDMYGEEAGGIGRRTLFYDTTTKIWWDKHPLDDTDVNKNTIGPYGGHPVQGIYRPIVRSGSEKEFTDSEYILEESVYDESNEANEFQEESNESYESEPNETFEEESNGEIETAYEHDEVVDHEFDVEFQDENVPESTEVIITNEYDVDPKYGVTGYLDVSAIKNIPLRSGFFIPAGYKRTGNIDIILYLHGLYDYGGYKYGMAYYWKNYSNIRECFYSGERNAILIAPALGSDPQVSDLIFRYQNGLDKFISACIKELTGRNQLSAGTVPNRIILAAHSAGGFPMSAILRNSNVLNANIVECWCFDCFYNYQWEKVLEKNAGKPFYHYWAFTTYGKISGPGARGNVLAKTYSNLKNIQPPNGIHHRQIIEYAWKNEINKRSWFTPIASSGSQVTKEVHETKDWSNAVRLNRSYGSSLGWNQYTDQINNLLLPYSGYQNVSLGEEAFAEALCNWQRKQGFSDKDSDGILGPNTWRVMQPMLKTTTAPPPPSYSPTYPPSGMTPPSVQNVFEFNKWHAQKILDNMNSGIIGQNFDSKSQLESISRGEQVLNVNPQSKIIQILPLICHISEQAKLNDYREIIIGSFIRGKGSDGSCVGHCEGRCIDINHTGGSFETSGSAKMVINILKYLTNLPAQYKKSLGFGMPLQGEFFGHKNLAKFKSVSPSNLINSELKQLVPQLGYVFPDNNNHLHIQVKWM